jgi:hypothetical protein
LAGRGRSDQRVEEKITAEAGRRRTSSRSDPLVEIIEVIAVGEREAFAVYLTALRRLGRAVQGE